MAYKMDVESHLEKYREEFRELYNTLKEDASRHPEKKPITKGLEESFNEGQTGVYWIKGGKEKETEAFLQFMDFLFSLWAAEKHKLDLSVPIAATLNFSQLRKYHTIDEVLAEITGQLKLQCESKDFNPIMGELHNRKHQSFIILQHLDKANNQLIEAVMDSIVKRCKEKQNYLFLLIATGEDFPGINGAKVHDFPAPTGPPSLELRGQEFSPEEQEVYTLLSIPVWFNRELANRLNTQFNKPSDATVEGILQNRAGLFNYEDKGWYFDKKSRQFLLEKAQALPKEKRTEIHSFLMEYYRATKKENASVRGKEAAFQFLYHQLHVDARAAEHGIMRFMDQADETAMGPLLDSLISIYESLATEGEEPLFYAYLKLFRTSLDMKTDGKGLKSIGTELDGIESNLPETGYDSLLKYIYLLRFFSTVHIHQKTPEKAIKKIIKKLRRLFAQGIPPGKLYTNIKIQAEKLIGKRLGREEVYMEVPRD